MDHNKLKILPTQAALFTFSPPQTLRGFLYLRFLQFNRWLKEVVGTGWQLTFTLLVNKYEDIFGPKISAILNISETSKYPGYLEVSEIFPRY